MHSVRLAGFTQFIPGFRVVKYEIGMVQIISGLYNEYLKLEQPDRFRTSNSYGLTILRLLK